VAASLAVKYENILKYLPSETTEIDSDILARRSANKGLAYGYTFIEKFVQLPFLVPQPSQSDFERFFVQLATSQSPQLPSAKSSSKSFRLVLPWRKNSWKHPISATSNQTRGLSPLSSDNPPPPIEPEQKEKEKAQEFTIKRLETIQVKFDKDSQTVWDVIMMVAPALDYNPRRIKQFINVFRLKVYIASTTGLFFEEQDSEGKLLQPSLTFEQLGKFTAISLKWPLLLLDLETDGRLLAKLQDFALRKYMPSTEGEKAFYFHYLFILRGSKTLKISLLWVMILQKWNAPKGDGEATCYWGGHSKLKVLMAYGCLEKSATEDNIQINHKFSLAAVNVEKLLQVSPRVIRQSAEANEQPQITPTITSLPPDFNLEMVDIPAGKFKMGSDEYDNEKPIHEVTVPAFQMGKYPVTQAQYQAVMGTNPSKFSGNPQNPVEYVSWFDAKAFCEKLSQLTGINYRLPTEAEWEYACRAGTQTRFSFGDDESQLGDYAWFDGNSNNTTHPVGKKRPNPWGLCDMHGQVWEWCADQYHDSYVNKPEKLKENGNIAWVDNNITNQSLMLLRGGSWNDYPVYCRSANRSRLNADYCYDALGFRVAVSRS
jgi:formylglycine-generating enzyme required for sulfatase activity